MKTNNFNLAIFVFILLTTINTKHVNILNNFFLLSILS